MLVSSDTTHPSGSISLKNLAQVEAARAEATELFDHMAQAVDRTVRELRNSLSDAPTEKSSVLPRVDEG